jgi:predicted restriction endonuclease
MKQLAEIHKKRISATLKKRSPKWMLGRKASEQTKKKMSLAHIGNKSRLGQKLSPEHIQKMSIARKGNKHWNWKGGITPINRTIRVSLEYKIWRKSVFERDNYQCVWCGAKNGEGKTIVLHADHIKPFAYYPELRFAIDNGRTLCIHCHRTTFKGLKLK